MPAAGIRRFFSVASSSTNSSGSLGDLLDDYLSDDDIFTPQ